MEHNLVEWLVPSDKKIVLSLRSELALWKKELMKWKRRQQSKHLLGGHVNR